MLPLRLGSAETEIQSRNELPLWGSCRANARLRGVHFMNIKGHFDTITRHKLRVMKYCFACGLYEQGLAHDLSKYSPTEFIPGCIYYQGDHSPNEAERAARGYT